MKKINKIFITLASIVSISSLPIVAAACDVEKTEEGMGENSGTKDQKDQTPQKDQKEQTPQKDQSNQTHPKGQKEQTPQKDQSNQTHPKGQKEQNTKKYRLPELKEFLDKNDGKLFETDGENAKDELESLASEGALKIIDGKIQHHSSRSGKGKKGKKACKEKVMVM